MKERKKHTLDEIKFKCRYWTYLGCSPEPCSVDLLLQYSKILQRTFCRQQQQSSVEDVNSFLSPHCNVGTVQAVYSHYTIGTVQWVHCTMIFVAGSSAAALGWIYSSFMSVLH